MNKQTTLAEGLNPVGSELIGETVYFEAYRLIKIDKADNLAASRRKGGPGGHKPYYDLIPGKVLQVTPTGVGITAAGGLYNRKMADIVLPEDLEHWISRNRGKWVMRGDQ